MKKIILIGILFLASCKKEEVKKEAVSECQCYEYHEAQQAVLNSYGTISVVWKYWKTTEKKSDFCSRETGLYVYSANGGTRYKVYCD